MIPENETIVQVLMRRDGMSQEEAEGLFEEAKDDLHARLEAGEHVDDQDFMEEWFGLEPDYVHELL